MRLTCPNCGAQYEVPDDVIPKDGRDVQCSNCGTTWFQPHKDAMEADFVEPDPSELRSALSDLGEDIPETEEAAEPEGEPDAETPDQSSTADAPRRQLDPDVQDILQEEAAHETRLRNEDAAGLETQPDLGLDDTSDDAERRAREARTRMDRLKGPDADQEPSIEEAVAVAAKSSRIDRLPDIDEINSSLRQTNSPAGAQDDARDVEDEPPRKGGFARGFAIPLIVVSVLAILYVATPQISDAVPALDPFLNSYVLMVDGARSWLNTQIDAFVPPEAGS